MPVTYQYLTDRTLASQSAITIDTLIHIVNPNDISQNPAGSSYKAKLTQLQPLFSGITFTGGSSNCISDLYVTNIHGCSPITIFDSVRSSGSTVSGQLSFAFGLQTSATTSAATSFGFSNLSSGIGSFTQGYGNVASGDISHAEGYGTQALYAGDHAEGFNTIANSNYYNPGNPYGCHAEGLLSVAYGNVSHAEGYFTQALGVASHTEGFGTVANGDYQHVQGSYNITGITTSGAFIIGNGSGPSNRSNLLVAANSGVTIYGRLSATTISATTYLNLPTTSSGSFLPLSGGTVTGQTFFTSGVTITGATIIKDSTGVTNAINTSTRTLSDENGFSSVVFTSQRTLNNLFGTSLDWNNKTLYKNNGSIIFDWENGILTGQTSVISSTISATTYQNLPNTVSGNYLPLSGGTVTGETSFTSGLTANTLNVTGLTQTSGITSTGGIIFPHKTITANYTATTSDYFINITGGTFDVTLPPAVNVEGKLIVVKNEGGGIINVLSASGETIDDRTDVLLTKGNSLQIVSDGQNWAILGYNISSTQANTGVISFTGLTKSSNTTFTVGPIKGFIVDDTTNPVIPFLTYVEYTGGTYTDNYVTTDFETFVYLTSGGTIGQKNVPLTEQERRQNIFLGKIGHPEKVSINLVFSQPDFVLTPLSQLRDMFTPINLINGGVYPSTNGANLKFNTSAGYIYGLGINFTSSPLSPNALSISGTSPCTFQYRTQTGGTVTNVTDIDPLNYDVSGTKTPIVGTKATNQRVFLLQNGTFRVQYGQTTYNTLTLAIEGLRTETFTTFPNFTNNAVLIGILSILSTATDLTDTAKAQFFFASKFGETIGAAGGVSTTNLQQAYNNSSNPEITINSTLDGISIKNGTGNADNVTKLLEGLNTAGSTTSLIQADGLISGSTLSTPSFTANTSGVTTTTLSATTIVLSGSNISSSWTSYVPTWTAGVSNPVIGDGSITGSYKLIGKTCFVRVRVAMGSTTTYGSGAWYFSLPFAATSPYGILFPAAMLDNGINWYSGLVNGGRLGDTTKSEIQWQNTSGVAVGLTSTVPFTWGVTDELEFNGSYEIA